MAKNGKDKIKISISISKEVAEILNVFNNRSKVIDDILSYLLLNLSPDEMLELIKAVAKGDNVALFLIEKKCKEFGGTGTQQVKEQKQEFWG